MMNSNEIKTAVRDYAAKTMIDVIPDLRAVPDKPYTFVMEVVIDGKPQWARIGITSTQLETKSKEAFNGSDCPLASVAFAAMLEQREKLAAEKEAEKAAKAAEREAKKKKKEE